MTRFTASGKHTAGKRRAMKRSFNKLLTINYRYRLIMPRNAVVFIFINLPQQLRSFRLFYLITLSLSIFNEILILFEFHFHRDLSQTFSVQQYPGRRNLPSFIDVPRSNRSSPFTLQYLLLRSCFFPFDPPERSNSSNFRET